MAFPGERLNLFLQPDRQVRTSVGRTYVLSPKPPVSIRVKQPHRHYLCLGDDNPEVLIVQNGRGSQSRIVDCQDQILSLLVAVATHHGNKRHVRLAVVH